MSKPSWDEYFMRIAETVSIRSPDPKYKVGAVIVSLDKHILATGYNGFVAGYDESVIDWSNREVLRPYIIHAEVNAILHAYTKLKDAVLYVTLSPCSECIKLVATAGIKQIVFKEAYKDYFKVETFCKDHGILLLQCP